MICASLPKTLNTFGPLLINKNAYLCFEFCNIAAELPNKGLCSCPPGKPLRGPQGGPRDPVEKPCFKSLPLMLILTLILISIQKNNTADSIRNRQDLSLITMNLLLKV